MTIATHQKKIATSAVYRLLMISIVSYGAFAAFFHLYPTQFILDSIQPTLTFLACIALLLYFHQNPVLRLRKTVNIYAAITVFTFTPATCYFTYEAWQENWRFIDTYPPISGMIILTSTLMMLMLPKRYIKLAAIFWAANALPVLHYLLFHPLELHTTRGLDLLFLFGPTSLLILVIIPYQQNMNTHMDRMSFELIRSKLDAARDFLTDTLNRRGLHNWLTRNDQNATIGVVLIDVDHFKNINDHHGHATGDHVLVEIASRLRTVYHENHCLARWGGEEFILVITNPQPAILNKLANDCHAVFSEFPYKEVGKVTTSIGVSRIGDIQDFTTLLEEADRALYHAKESGRDKVIMYSEIRTQLTNKMKKLALFNVH